MIICYVGPAWGHSGTHGGPKMAQNSTKKAENVSKSAILTETPPLTHLQNLVSFPRYGRLEKNAGINNSIY